MNRYPTRRIDSTNFSQNDEEEEEYSRDAEARGEAEREENAMAEFCDWCQIHAPFEPCSECTEPFMCLKNGCKK